MNCPECGSINLECLNRTIRQRRAAEQRVRCVIVHWKCQRCGTRFEQVIAAAVAAPRFVEV